VDIAVLQSVLFPLLPGSDIRNVDHSLKGTVSGAWGVSTSLGSPGRAESHNSSDRAAYSAIGSIPHSYKRRLFLKKKSNPSSSLSFSE
jgi:hypothetical protein